MNGVNYREEYRGNDNNVGFVSWVCWVNLQKCGDSCFEGGGYISKKIRLELLSKVRWWLVKCKGVVEIV